MVRLGGPESEVGGGGVGGRLDSLVIVELLKDLSRRSPFTFGEVVTETSP